MTSKQLPQVELPQVAAEPLKPAWIFSNAVAAIVLALLLPQCRRRAPQQARHVRQGVMEAEVAAATGELERMRSALVKAKEALALKEAECTRLLAAAEVIKDAARCPILQDYPHDPVAASDGQTYSRRAIRKWLLHNGRSPVTREALHGGVFSNRFAEIVLQELEQIGILTRAQDADEELPQEAAPVLPPPRDLMDAIQEGDEREVLILLRNEQVPVHGLNGVNRDGWTALHLAIGLHMLTAALGVLARPDFQGVNARVRFYGSTALHLAASRGLLSICQAIVQRSDFTELQAADSLGSTALQDAQEQGHDEVAAFLQAAVAWDLFQ